MDKIGLIAGNRKFPLLFAEAAKRKGFYVVAIAIKGDTSIKLKKLVDKIYWFNLGDFRKIFKVFKDEGVENIVMAGQISPWRLFSREVQNNKDIRSLLDKIKDKRAATIFGSIADELEREGLRAIDSTTFIEDYLPEKGVLTKTEPPASLWEDINFGLELARNIAGLDIGQTVAVKNKAIVAVEALEGTDNLILRAGRLARGGVVIVKVSRPQQDMRFDIPVIGLKTIKNLVRVGAACLAIESKKTLFIDREESLALADKKGIAIIAA